jgi:hypothetical protein
MAIEYSFRIEDDVLRVKATGKDDNVEQVIQYGLAIIEAATSYRCPKVLCDERELDYDLRTFETFEAAKLIAEQTPKVAKVAIVCKPEHMDEAEFWETVAVNRGLHVRVFHELEEAEEWMRE